jgi:hypothetical protein
MFNLQEIRRAHEVVRALRPTPALNGRSMLDGGLPV